MLTMHWTLDNDGHLQVTWDPPTFQNLLLIKSTVKPLPIRLRYSAARAEQSTSIYAARSAASDLDANVAEVKRSVDGIGKLRMSRSVKLSRSPTRITDVACFGFEKHVDGL